MSWSVVLAHIFLPSAVAAVAGFGAWRCWRLLRYARDPRLLKLMWFYALFAASLIPWIIWVGQPALHVVDALSHTGNHSVDVHGTFAAERVNGYLIAHHVLMLGSLGVAIQAFGHKRTGTPAAAVVGLAFFGPLIPVVLAIEAAMTLYLAVRAILNHMERRTPGALQVAAGFLLFFIGHLSFFLLHHPGAARTPIGDMLALVGIVLLVQLLPRPSA
jgi:hypothetical protein